MDDINRHAEQRGNRDDAEHPESFGYLFRTQGLPQRVRLSAGFFERKAIRPNFSGAIHGCGSSGTQAVRPLLSTPDALKRYGEVGASHRVDRRKRFLAILYFVAAGFRPCSVCNTGTKAPLHAQVGATNKPDERRRAFPCWSPHRDATFPGLRSVAGKGFTRSCLIRIVRTLGEGGQNLPNSLVDSFLGFRVRRERFVVPQIGGTEANGNVAVRHDDLSKCFGLCRFSCFLNSSLSPSPTAS